MINTIKEEDLAFLIDLGKKMNAQSNRMTQSPMFVVKQKVKRYSNAECCSEAERVDLDYLDKDDLCEKCTQLYEDDEELPEWCDDCLDGCFVHYNWEDEIVEECGSFFTADAAQEHIDLNHYHYCKPFTYAIPSWRNFEMKRILQILSSLGSEDGTFLNHYGV